MRTPLACLLILIHCVSYTQSVDKVHAASFIVSDSLSTVLFAHFDEQGVLDRYSSRVFTPVCEGTKCYAIEVDLYWDCIGRFERLDTVPGKRLTKLDHIPFTSREYLKMEQILSDPYSILANFERDKLISGQRKASTDGFTGATTQEVRNAVIDGAVYSCYTLWHIANGPVRDSIKRYSANLIDKDFVVKITNIDDPEYDYFLLQNFSESHYAEFNDQIFEMLMRGKGYFQKRTIEGMPQTSINDTSYQQFFMQMYPTLDYFTKLALVERLDASFLSTKLRNILREDLDDRGSRKNQLIKGLVEYPAD